jgi:hypothetical protein
VAVSVPPLRAQFRLRHEWDLGVHSRPRGSIAVFTIIFVAWRPRAEPAAAAPQR